MEKLTSRRNPLCTHLKQLGENRGYRYEHREFLCDGIKLLEEAVNNGAEITNILTASHLPFPLPLEANVYYAERGLINSISPLKNAQDTLFSCKMPYQDSPAEFKGTHILLDGIQDPGNVGTIIRTANAFRISSVILTGGCADPYNPKTIRASMGAIFRQRIHHIKPAGLSVMLKSGVRFVGAVPGEGQYAVSNVVLCDSVIAIGSEGSGLSGEILSLCSDRVTIPVAPECESLNAAVAAAILMWESSKCQH